MRLWSSIVQKELFQIYENGYLLSLFKKRKNKLNIRECTHFREAEGKLNRKEFNLNMTCTSTN